MTLENSFINDTSLAVLGVYFFVRPGLGRKDASHPYPNLAALHPLGICFANRDGLSFKDAIGHPNADIL